MVARFLEKQRSGEYRVSISQQELTAHDVASRILRRENFLIALIDQNVLDLRPVIPILGPSVLSSSCSPRGTLTCVALCFLV